MALGYSNPRKLIQTLASGVEWLKLRNLTAKVPRGTQETHRELMWVRPWAGRAPRPLGETGRLPSLAPIGGGEGGPHTLSTEHHQPPRGARSSLHCPHPTQPLAIPAGSRLALTSGYKPLALISVSPLSPPCWEPSQLVCRALDAYLTMIWDSLSS